MRADFDELEDGGHKLVLLHGPMAGVSAYCCDRCQSLFFIGSDRVLVFHPAGGSSLLLCSAASSPDGGLKAVIESLNDFLMPYDDGEPARDLRCPRCGKVVDYVGEPHDNECVVREVMES